MGLTWYNDSTANSGRIDSAALARLLKARDWSALRDQVRSLLEPLGVDDFLLRMDKGSCPATSGSHLFGSVPYLVGWRVGGDIGPEHKGAFLIAYRHGEGPI